MHLQNIYTFTYQKTLLHTLRLFLKSPKACSPSKHSSWWRRLEDVFCLRLQKTSSRRLDQDEYVRLSLTSSEDVFKASSRCLGQDQYIRLGHTSSRRLQDVFKTSLRRLAKAPSRRPAKISSRSFEDVSSSWTALVNTSLRSIQHVSEMIFSKDD